MSEMTLRELTELYEDAQRCAEVAGLVYQFGDEAGITRRRSGSGWAYRDARRAPLTDAAVKERISALAIPPAWRKVWICPSADGHILATGEDARGRKQYLYHPRWRAIRDLLNFYRMILFGRNLPAIRTHVGAQLRRRTLDRDRVVATMLAILDATLIRIGNEVYAEENDSYGLSTLTGAQVTVSGGITTFLFPGKSGKRVELQLDDARIARVVEALLGRPRRRVFTVDGQTVGADEVNAALLEICGERHTAKDFRTWGGTLAAFRYLRERTDSDRPNERIVVEAVDEAAEALGNTRAVARAHYVHPHVLETFTENTFADYLAASRPVRGAHLAADERALLGFLQTLFRTEFSLLATSSCVVGDEGTRSGSRAP